MRAGGMAAAAAAAGAAMLCNHVAEGWSPAALRATSALHGALHFRGALGRKHRSSRAATFMLSDSLGEVGEFRIKGEGHWAGVMQRFSFTDETGKFAVPEPYSTDGPPLPYSLEMHRCGLDTY
ncbi:hypothetical protein JKP88DRAFT_352597, partial [Tribonema minus]